MFTKVKDIKKRKENEEKRIEEVMQDASKVTRDEEGKNEGERESE